MSKRILVTGSAGFIGFHLAKALKDRGDQVIGFDNFNDYYSPELKRERASILQRCGVDTIEGDICELDKLKEVVVEKGITHICHLAAQAGVRYSIENPKAYLKSNVEGFLNILEICREFPSIPLTYASSSSVYGLNKKIPFSEDDRTDHQVSLYGATKKADEHFAYTYHHLFGIKTCGLRFFTVYGPWGRPDMAYYSFAESITKGKPIEVFNNGLLKRDFTYIDDVVEGTIKAIDLEESCDIFNLGNNKSVGLMDFINTLEEALGKKAELKFLPMQKGDVFETYADISKSQKILGFKPKTSLKEGLAKFVDWFNSQKALSANQ